MTEFDIKVQEVVQLFVDNVQVDEIIDMAPETQEDIIFLFIELANLRIWQIQNNEGFDISDYENMTLDFQNQLTKLVKTYMNYDLKELHDPYCPNCRIKMQPIKNGFECPKCLFTYEN